MSSPEVIDTTEGLLCIDHVEIDDGVDRDGHGVAGQDLEEDNKNQRRSNIEKGCS